MGHGRRASIPSANLWVVPQSDGDTSETSREATEATLTETSAGLVRFVIAGITVVATIAVAIVHWSYPVSALLLAGLVAVSGWLAVIDFEERRLPNVIVGPLAAAVTVAVVLAGFVNNDLERSGRSLLFGLAAATFFLIGNLLGGMGMGDVKYAFPLGATLGWFGLQPLINAAFFTVLIGGLAAVYVLASGKGRRYRLPYGPFMSAGLVVGLLSATPGL